MPTPHQRRADPVLVSVGAPMSQLFPSLAPSTLLTSHKLHNEGPPPFALFRPSVDWMKPTHIGKGHLLHLLSPPIQVLIFPETSSRTHPARVFNKLAGHPAVQSSPHIKLTITGNVDILWMLLEIQNLGSYSRPPESESAFYQDTQVTYVPLKFEKLCPTAHR